MSDSLFNSLLLGDGRLPTGGYSDSAGLEPAVMAGLKLDEVYSYMTARLHTITKIEASASVLAHRLATNLSAVSSYEKLEASVNARTPSSAQRKASQAMGRAILHLGNSLQPDDTGITALNELNSPPTRGTAMGVVSAMLGVNEESCAQVCCYDDLQRIAEATLKLLPTDPAIVTGWLIEAGKNVPKIVKSALSIREPSELPAINAPRMEHWAEEHDQKTKRLFMA